MSSLFVVIAVHNRVSLTRTCLHSLLHQTCKDFDVVVVDDGSTDGTSEMIRQEFPHVTVLHGDGNLWWTKATNLGVRHALANSARYIMTLNDDTLAEPEFLRKIIENAQRNPSALIGAAAIDANSGQLIYGGERVVWWSAGYKGLLAELKPEDRHGLHPVTHFPGRGLLIPAEVFEKIGLFDEKHFPHYAADYDFTHRAVRYGFKIYCTYDAPLRIYPEESGNLAHRREKSLKNYYGHLFGMKGGGNLWRFTLYGIRNCPLWFLPLFLLVGITRRIAGYLLDWLQIRTGRSLPGIPVGLVP